jgi:UDP-N-acetylglucosamine transferase subunit ALG13
LFEEIEMLKVQGEIKEKIICQTGSSDFIPKKTASKAFFGMQELERILDECRIVVAHGGAGSIIDALSKNKPLVVVPRLEKFKEHTNNHQLDLAKALEKRALCIAVENIKELKTAIANAKKSKVKSNRGKLVGKIKEFLEQSAKQ